MFLAPVSTRAAPPPAPVSGFDVTGFIQAATLGGADALAGGSLTVNGQKITIPRNTIVVMPATSLTWEELFELAPAPYGPTQSGLALTDVPTPLATYEAHVQGNRVGDEYIAGLVYLSQQSLNVGQGWINYIDYNTGELRVGGIIGDPTTGERVRLNDPIGRFGRASSPDVRFTMDEDNPTVRATTGYPVCVPRAAPSVGDPKCPQSNRPLDPATGLHQTIFTMNPPGAVGLGLDPTQQAPFEVGDFVTYSGVLMKDVAPATVGPMTSAASTYVAAYAMIANLSIFTSPGQDPAYLAIDVTLLGVAGAPIPGFAQEATARTRFEGFSTDPTRPITLWGMDVDPCAGTVSDRSWGGMNVDPGPPTGAVRGRWRFRPPNVVLQMPPAGAFLPATREVRARISGASNPVAANGLVSGQYHAPIASYIFPEPLAPGNLPVPSNFQDMPFLAKGSGPWPGGGPNPIASGIVGQLSPWPGGAPSPVPTPASCGPAVQTPPTAVAGPAQTVPSASAVTLDGSASTDPNGLPLTFAWTQTAGPSVTLSSATEPRPTFAAPAVPAAGTAVALTFALVVTDTAGLASAPASVTITVSPGAAGPVPPFANAGPNQTVASNAPVLLNASASSDPNVPPLPLTFQWTQIAPLSPLVALTGANTANASFTAPIVPPTSPPQVLTFNLTVQNSVPLGANATVDVTVNPVVAPTANAGPNRAALAGATVALDGTASFDPQGLPITYTWTQVSGTPVTLAAAGTATPSFTAPAVAGTIGFVLTVNNGFLTSFGSLVTITVTPAADTVTILSAVYRVGQQRLDVTAISSVPNGAVLTLVGLPSAAGTQLTLIAGVPTATVVGIPNPGTVTVTSSLGGTRTSPITRLR